MELGLRFFPLSNPVFQDLGNSFSMCVVIAHGGIYLYSFMHVK